MRGQRIWDGYQHVNGNTSHDRQNVLHDNLWYPESKLSTRNKFQKKWITVNSGKRTMAFSQEMYDNPSSPLVFGIIFQCQRWHKPNKKIYRKAATTKVDPGTPAVVCFKKWECSSTKMKSSIRNKNKQGLFLNINHFTLKFVHKLWIKLL